MAGLTGFQDRCVGANVRENSDFGWINQRIVGLVTLKPQHHRGSCVPFWTPLEKTAY